jgi:hypothetical protein
MQNENRRAAMHRVLTDNLITYVLSKDKRIA